MGSAKLPSSILNLVKSIIGSGILAVPFAFGQTGVVPGALLLAACGIGQAFTLHLLALCVLQAHGRNHESSFSALALRSFGGRRIASALVSICQILFAFGASVSYFVVIGDLLPEVMDYFGMLSYPWNSRRFWITVIGFFFELPLCCLSNLDSLKFSSMIGTAGIMYIVFAVAVFATGCIDLPAPEQKWSAWVPAQSKYTSLPGMIESLPLFVFSFGCAINVPTMILELEVMTMKQIDAMIALSITISTGIYMLMGVCGAIAFGASVQGNSLKSFPNDHEIGGLLSIFARAAIVLAVMGGIPLYMYPFRATVSEMLFGKATKELNITSQITIAVILFLLVYGVAMLVESLDEVMALVGSTSMMLIGFSLPALFYYFGHRTQVADVEDTDFGVGLQGQARGIGLLRKSAGVIATVSLALVPVLLTGEVYKMVTGHGH